MRRLLLATLCLLSSSRPGASASEPPPVRLARPVQGEPFPAQLVGIDDHWTVALSVQGDRRTMDGADLVLWGEATDAEGRPQIVLGDGGLLAARIVEIAPERIVAESRLWGTVPLPLEKVRGIVFRPPVEPWERDELLRRIGAAEGWEDQLWLENGDVVTGLLTEAPAERAERARFGVDAIWMQLKKSRVKIPAARVIAAVLNPALVEASAPRGLHALIGLSDGSLLMTAATAPENDSVTISLVGGVALQASAQRLWSEITLVQPFGPRVDYLSDRTPVHYDSTPFLSRTWPYRADGNVGGGRLRAGGRIYAKGLGAHSTSRIVYDVPPDARAFQVEAAVDQRSGLEGSVLFRVSVTDDGASWRTACESEVLRGGQSPQPLSAEVTGLKQIALTAEWADQGDVRDWADWLNARFVK